MASNLFQLNHNFLTHKCPSLSTKRHLFKHTELYGPSEMIAYTPQDIFQSLSAPIRLCTCKKIAIVLINKRITFLQIFHPLIRTDSLY